MSSEPARDAYQRETDQNDMAFAAPIRRGTVGWANNPDVLDLGDNTNGGVTLIRVTLYRGKSPTDDVQAGLGQGREVLAILPDGMFRIPPAGTEVIVAFPDGDLQLPGIILAGVARPKKTSGVYKNMKTGEMCLFAGNSDGSDNPAKVVIKQNKVILMVEDGSGNSLFLSLEGGANPAVRLVAPFGVIIFDGSGFHVRAGEAALDLGTYTGTAFSALSALSGGGNAGTTCQINAANINLTGICSLGIPSVAGTYYQAGMYPLPTPTPNGLTPVPLCPGMAPFMFFSPTVRIAP